MPKALDPMTLCSTLPFSPTDHRRAHSGAISCGMSKKGETKFNFRYFCVLPERQLGKASYRGKLQRPASEANKRKQPKRPTRETVQRD